ncbi:MAG: NAD-dependent epimerase/dehydratase family protein [Acidimicrobiales bacterium]
MGHVVLGAGPLGTSLAARLAAAGIEPRLLSVMGNPAYDMPGTDPEVVDGTDVAALVDMSTDADVIYLCLNAHYVDWYELFPPRLDAAMEAASTVGAKLVYHDNAYMYGSTARPLTEDLPYSSKTRKGRLRGEMASKFLEAAQAGQFDGAIGRSADMYGPGALNSAFNSTLGERHFIPLLEGRPVRILGHVDKPHTYAFVDDVARGLHALATHDGALGQAWHIPAGPTLSHRELVTMAFEEAGLRPRISGSRASGYFVRVIGRFQSDLGEVAELLSQFEKAFVISHEKFESAFGAQPTPHHIGLRQTLEWYRSRSENAA